MNKIALFVTATTGTMIQALAFAAPNLSVTTQSPISVTTQPVSELMINQNGDGDTSCEVVSVGTFYCTIDGKGYYCTTDSNPDKDKDCVAALVVHPPRSFRPIVPMGALRFQ
jgi:hypothetical protein